MEKDHRSLSLPVEFMEHRNNKQEQTYKSVKKLGNKRKRKRIEPLEVFISFIIIFTFLVQKYLHIQYTCN